jgi:hypothetical protein
MFPVLMKSGHSLGSQMDESRVDLVHTEGGLC